MPHHHEHVNNNAKQIRLAFLLNLSFTIIELIGGMWTNSIAIISDALHDLGDSFSLGVAWFLDKYSYRKADYKFSYGYRRFTLLAALINTIVLIVGSILVLSKAIPRLFQPEYTNAEGMIYFALGGILVNGFAVLRLRKGSSINVRVVMWALLEDVLGWVAVLVVGIVLIFKDIQILDPLLSILITLYVLFNVFRNLKDTLLLFLQGVPENVSIQEIEDNFRKIDGVVSTHHTHVWSLDGEHNVLSTHIVVTKSVSREFFLSIKKSIGDTIKHLNLKHTTIEVEYEDENYCANDLS